ncbi:sialate O-acetylesterase [Escherichia coli]
MYHHDFNEKIGFWYVIALAGQSNGMAYGEGIPLPDTLDKPESRVKQLARRKTITPGGKECKFNEIIPADHCLHDVQDMSGYHHPAADLHKGEYGCVGQGLHIAKKLLPYIPEQAGILLVPCCRGGAAFTVGAEGMYVPDTGATADAMRWGTGTALYEDLVARVKVALEYNRKNKLLSVCWMQGEFDLMSPDYEKHPDLFYQMVTSFRSELSEYSSQCVGNSSERVPWLCGDTTWYWKESYQKEYDFIYGHYRQRTDDEIHFLSFQDSNRHELTNEPEEDADDLSVGYLGASWRTELSWTTSQRSTHFNSMVRRGVIAECYAQKIRNYL